MALIKHKAKYNRKGNSSYGDNSSGDGSDDEDDEDFGKFGRTTKKKAPVRPKKVMDAIFRIKWWRIVLGKLHLCINYIDQLLCMSTQMKPITSKTGKQKQRRHVVL